MGKEHKEWGTQAEQIAADYLIGEGYAILERNWRLGKTHEVDIIIQKGDTIGFVEVKARRDDEDDALEAVNNRKRRKMVQAADAYLAMQQHDYYYRFDIVTVVGTPDDYKVTFFPDAFIPMVNNIF